MPTVYKEAQSAGRVSVAPTNMLKRYLQALVNRLLGRRSMYLHSREDVERTLQLQVLAVHQRRRDR